MKQIKRDDLFRHLDLFLKDRGIELKEDASLTKRLRDGCHVLSDTINKAQSAIGRARKEVDGRIDIMREIIHEKTAPPNKKDTPKEQTMKKTKKKAAKKAPAKKKAVKKAAPAKKAAVKKAPAKKKAVKKVAKKAPAK
ncbi:MAG: hypothetical protein O2964_13715, partial [Verrucomicrobia bacterium]|nr:hypothetical protein [Verrucomicrobiota bacterium]